MELVARKLESADDITADETAASPSTDTHWGVRWRRTSGRISDLAGDTVTVELLVYSHVSFKLVCDQSRERFS